jgi:fructose-specific phosphotransferase system IIA component
VKRIDTANLCKPELFFPDLNVRSKEELFATLVDALAEQGVAIHREALLTGLLERERLGTTGVGCGVAIPHTRSTVVGAPALAFARLRSGIDFAAADGQPVQLVFLIVAPYGTPGALYTPLLAAVARAAHDEVTRGRLRELETFAEFETLMRSSLKTP